MGRLAGGGADPRGGGAGRRGGGAERRKGDWRSGWAKRMKGGEAGRAGGVEGRWIRLMRGRAGVTALMAATAVMVYTGSATLLSSFARAAPPCSRAAPPCSAASSFSSMSEHHRNTRSSIFGSSLVRSPWCTPPLVSSIALPCLADFAARRHWPCTAERSSGAGITEQLQPVRVGARSCARASVQACACSCACACQRARARARARA